MNALERLEAAIAKIESTRDAAFSGDWEALGSGVRNGDHWYVVAEDEAIALITANDGSDEAQREPTAVLISILHRTIEPQLATLRDAVAAYVQLRIPGNVTFSAQTHAYALADAILGGA